MSQEKKKLTSVSGRPIAKNQNVKTAGKRGPMLMEGLLVSRKISIF